MEVIDGQQRLTTLMLLLRAFYDGFANANDKKSVSTRQRIEKCIWKTDEYDEPNMDILKINSDVATDEDKEEFLSILKTGQCNKDQKSRYAKNFKFFKQEIEQLLHNFPTFYALMPNRILNNCILLPIEAESQNTALRIFSTLNDRGLPLSDADIFKAQFYKYYAKKDQKNKDDEGKLDDEKFYQFLEKTTAFVWTYAVTNPGVNALRTPIYTEMINIVNDKDVTFSEFRFDAEKVKSMFNNYVFSNTRTITKSMLAWWAYNKEEQNLMPLETTLEIEHIFARKRQEAENSLVDKKNLEVLGNKTLLEKRINIRASDYRFSDKIKYYKGFTNAKGQIKEGTKIYELSSVLSSCNDFSENDITTRNNNIIDTFVDYLKQNNLTKNE